ncbi:DUF1573 domain-containing protein [bacterium]|nr:DUF1573 domain-containing protein [bacterium]
MQKHMLVFVSILFWVTCFTLPLWAQPKIHIDERTHDFGSAAVGAMLNHEFVFKNVGDKPLKILNTSTTCGCTAAVLSQKEIPASATGAVSVTMAVRSPGDVSHSAMLQTNDPQTPKVSLVLKAKVRKIWNFHPTKTFKFMAVPFNSQVTQELLLQNLDEKPFKVIASKVSREEFAVGVGEPKPNGIPIIVTFTAGKKKERIIENIEIKTDYEVNPVARANVFAEVTGYVSFNRRQMYFGILEPGRDITRELKVSIASKADVKDFQITKIESDKPNISGKVVGKSEKGDILVRLTFQAPDRRGYITGRLKFHTNVKEEPVAVLPYSALVRPPRTSRR